MSDSTTENDTAERWIDPVCKPLSIDASRPFVKLPDGGLMAVAGKRYHRQRR